MYPCMCILCIYIMYIYIHNIGVCRMCKGNLLEEGSGPTATPGLPRQGRRSGLHRIRAGSAGGGKGSRGVARFLCREWIDMAATNISIHTNLNTSASIDTNTDTNNFLYIRNVIGMWEFPTSGHFGSRSTALQ